MAKLSNVCSFASLRRSARSNGMDITDGGSGRIIVRSLLEKNHPIIKGFDTREEAQAWINKTGQADGAQLDNNETIDTDNVTHLNIPSDDGIPRYAADGPYRYIMKAGDLVSTFSSWLNSKPFITRNRDYFLNLDTKYNSKFHQSIVEPIEHTRNIRNEMIKRPLEEFGRIQKASKLTSSQAEKVQENIQSMSPAEVEDHFLDRQMNPMEVALAQRIAGSNVDLERIFTYRHELSKLNNEFSPEVRASHPEYEQEYQDKLAKYADAFGLDQNHQRVAELLGTIEKMDANDVSHGAIIRLARSLNNGVGEVEMSASEHAIKNKFTSTQYSAAKQLKDLYARVNSEFNVNSGVTMNDFMTHAKLFTDGDLARAIKMFPEGGTNAKNFFPRMAYTGEISAYETDPYRALLRYMKAGYDVHSGMFDAIQNSEKLINDNVKFLDDGVQQQARNVAHRYINDVRGLPEAGDQAATAAVNYIMDKYKLGDDSKMRSSLASAVGRTINLGALGGRMALGISHFAFSTVMSMANRSATYTARMLKNSVAALDNTQIMDELHSKGVFQGSAPFSPIKSDYYDNPKMSKVGSVIDKTADAAFKATLLPNIYEGLSAGHYLTTYQDALSALTDYSRQIGQPEYAGEDGMKRAWSQVEHKTFLNQYDQPVKDRFKQLARVNPLDAAHYLGTQALEDLVGTFGSGSHPYMWGTSTGRVIGQFGNFSMWGRISIQRMASRGSLGQRLGSVAKLAAAHYLISKAEDETGVDLARFDPYHVMKWMYGPLVETAEDVSHAMVGNGYVQQEAKRRLMKQLPIDKNGNLHPSIFVPLSYAVDGLVHGVADMQKGNVATGAVEVAGFRKTHTIRKSP